MQLATSIPESAAAKPRPQVDFSAWGLRAAALSYLSIMILLPLYVVFTSGLQGGLAAFWSAISQAQAVSALSLTISTAAIMTLINMLMGTVTAYVLVRYRFWGKSILDAMVDLPFAIPSLVTGVMLVLLYGPQTVLGAFFQDTWDIRIIFSPIGIVLALLFLGYPFVIRSVQPVFEQMDVHQPEAAYTLGASSWYSFRRVIFPYIRPAMLSGGLLGFARALGEFGAIVLVAGNIPLRTQTAAVYIYGQVEGGNMPAASAVSVALVSISLLVTLIVEGLQRRKADA
jgi:sulfate/thiosulfate transport system permease protein